MRELDGLSRGEGLFRKGLARSQSPPRYSPKFGDFGELQAQA